MRARHDAWPLRWELDWRVLPVAVRRAGRSLASPRLAALQHVQYSRAGGSLAHLERCLRPLLAADLAEELARVAHHADGFFHGAVSPLLVGGGGETATELAGNQMRVEIAAGEELGVTADLD